MRGELELVKGTLIFTASCLPLTTTQQQLVRRGLPLLRRRLRLPLLRHYHYYYYYYLVLVLLIHGYNLLVHLGIKRRSFAIATWFGMERLAAHTLHVWVLFMLQHPLPLPDLFVHLVLRYFPLRGTSIVK